MRHIDVSERTRKRLASDQRPGPGPVRMLAGTLLAGLASPALAQSPPPAPQPRLPSRDEINGITAPTQRMPAPAFGPVRTERSDCPLASPDYATVTFPLTDVTFGGLREVNADELLPSWSSLAGKTHPVAALCQIRDDAAEILRRKGYLAAIEIPAQSIVDGHVRMEVLTARISAVRIRGSTAGAESKLEGYLAPLARSEALSIRQAERALLLAGDLPGYDVSMRLRPAGTAPGDFIGETGVTRERFNADLSIQNLSGAATGPWGAQLRLQAFGLTGLGDATSIGYFSTSDRREQKILQVAHEFRPGSKGLVLGGQFTRAWTHPGIAGIGNLDLRARTLLVGGYARLPLVRSLNANLWLSAGLDVIDQDTDLIGPLTRDRLRVGWLRAEYDAVDGNQALPRWRVSSALELRRGLNLFGASRACHSLSCATLVPASRADGRATATTIRWQSEFERRFGQLALSVAPRAQYAFRPLLSFEEFSAGNYTIGRGYEPGVLVGDDALGFTLEARGPRMRLTAKATVRLQPFSFVDHVQVWNKDAPSGMRLASVGAGVRAELGTRFRLEATVAVPLSRPPALDRRPGTRFLVSLTSRLLPWNRS